MVARKTRPATPVKPSETGSDDFHAPAPGAYERIGAVTVPQLKTVDGEPIYVRITAAIRTDAKKDKNGALKQDEDGNPSTIDTVRVQNLKDGQLYSLVCGKALSQNLKEALPNDGYVGLCFEITKHPAAAGKRWKPYSVFQVRDPDHK